MMQRTAIALMLAGGLVGGLAIAQTPPATAPFLQPTPPPTTRPFLSNATTRPSQLSAEEMLREMLQPSSEGAVPLVPVPNEAPPVDLTTGQYAVAPRATTLPAQPDDTPILDRVGRLTRSADGKFLEFTLDADSTAMVDPPMLLLPNHKLAQLEDLVNNSYQDMKIRVSGELTEYRGRNYLLIERWSQVQDVAQPFVPHPG